MSKRKIKNRDSTKRRHKKDHEENAERNLCCSSYLCDYLIPKDAWLVKDKCGIIFAIKTWCLVIFGEMVVTFVILLPAKDATYSVINGVIFNALAFLALASHAATMFTNPVDQIQ